MWNTSREVKTVTVEVKQILCNGKTPFIMPSSAVESSLKARHPQVQSPRKSDLDRDHRSRA